MHPLSMFNICTLLCGALLLAQASAQFQISELELRAANQRHSDQNTTIQFKFTDNFRNGTFSHCNTSFAPSTATATFYPRHAVFCDSNDFGWYFASFTSIANFSITMQHAYIDPSIGPMSTIDKGTSNPINPQTNANYTCQYSAMGGGVCCLKNGSAPIGVEITSVIGK